MSEHSNPNHMFISRHEIRQLRELLHEIPSLAEELGIAITKQARLGVVGRSRKPRRPSEQPLPYHLAAAEVAEELHNELVGWVRLTCEQRAIDYDGKPSTPGVARWLEHNIIALAMTEGADTAYPNIRDMVQRAEWIVCPPNREVVDEEQVEQARRLRLNPSGIAILVKELDEKYRHLTARRVRHLRDVGKVKAVPGPWHPDWPELFVVGEVLDAHLVVPIRERHAKAS